MNTKIVIKPHEYYDSVRLMQTAEMIRRDEGVEETILIMATDSNKRLLDVAGLLTDEVGRARPDDLIIAIVAADEDIVEVAMRKAEQLLKERAVSSAQLTYRTMDSALAAVPDSNLALISVPGEYAAAEARRALERGLNVMVFSDNVPLDEEVSLKQLARERGALLMGPDCGTAIINGVGLGFANVVRRGPVGIVGASGTGIQEITVLIDSQGVGISHAIGTGGRDLSPAVGGLTMLDGLELLGADPATEVIVLTSKPPDPQVSRTVLQAAAQCGKPVVVNFLGGDPRLVADTGATPAATLADAAGEAVRLVTGQAPDLMLQAAEIERLAAEEAGRFGPQQKYIRGLFSGGTLCYEAMLILKDNLGNIYSNIPLQPELRLNDAWTSYQHTLVDLGEDEFTQGRAHPMIDSTLRVQRLLNEAQDPELAVLLLDIVLGYGAHDDPAGSLAQAIKQAKTKASEAGRHLAVIASVCGTAQDPQNLDQQQQTLRDVGVTVMASNAQASQLATGIIEKINPTTHHNLSRSP